MSSLHVHWKSWLDILEHLFCCFSHLLSACSSRAGCLIRVARCGVKGDPPDNDIHGLDGPTLQTLNSL